MRLAIKIILFFLVLVLLLSALSLTRGGDALPNHHKMVITGGSDADGR